MTGNLRETLFSYLFGKLLVFKTSESMEAYASFISKPSTAAKFKKKRFPASDRGWLVGMDLIVAAAPASFEAESSSAAAAAGGASVTWAAGGNLLQGVDIRNVCSMFGAVSEEELTSVGALDNQLLGLQVSNSAIVFSGQRQVSAVNVCARMLWICKSSGLILAASIGQSANSTHRGTVCPA